jgi:TonB family protein
VSGREYGVNLTYAVYQYDPARSPSVEEVVRLSSTFSSPKEEMAHLRENNKLEGMEVRHVRSVGLRDGQAFDDAVRIGAQYLELSIIPRKVARGYLKLDMKATFNYGSMLDAGNVEFDNFETVLLRGGRGMFGVDYRTGPGGRRESFPSERAILISITPEIVPVSSLRNRPEELARPVDEFGGPISLKEGDRFTPPSVTERVTPKFEAERGIKGSVLLAGVITPEGRVTNIRVIRSLESSIDDRAVDAFRQFGFSPALLNGKPVRSTFREEVTFADRLPTLLEIQEEAEKRRRLEKERKEREKQEARRRKP